MTDAVLAAAVIAVALIVAAAFLAPILLIIPVLLALAGMGVAYTVARSDDGDVTPVVARTNR